MNQAKPKSKLVSELKSEQRAKAKAMLAAISDREEREAKLRNALTAFLKKQKGFWAIYRALDIEAKVHDLEKVKGASLEGLHFVYPAVTKAGLEFWQVEGSLGEAAFCKSRFGIMEPLRNSPNKLMPVQDLNGLVIPGLAFDRKGGRLGWGKGYYDQALKLSRGIKVGVCFSDLLWTEVATEDFDQRMDWVLTDQEQLEITPS